MTLNNVYAIGDTVMGVVTDDITGIAYVDAVVNAAKNSLLGGGGVDGAIHRAAGPELLEECRGLGGCETGKAKITGAYKMPCKHIIHTVGPVWQGGGAGEAELLASCYRSSLELALASGLRSVAFPSISTGIFSYPLDEAAYIAVHAVMEFIKEHPGGLSIVLWACIDERTSSAYKRALEQAAGEFDAEMDPGMMVVASSVEISEAMKDMVMGFDDLEDDAPSEYLS